MTQNELLEIILRNIDFIQLKKCDVIANEVSSRFQKWQSLKHLNVTIRPPTMRT